MEIVKSGFDRSPEASISFAPVALLLLGIAALAYAIAPRASAGIAYGLVTLSFLWLLAGVAALGLFRRRDLLGA